MSNKCKYCGKPTLCTDDSDGWGVCTACFLPAAIFGKEPEYKNKIEKEAAEQAV